MTRGAATVTSGDGGVGRVVYMYLDEAGNFDFSGKAGRFFFMTCLVTRRPFPAAAELDSLKYDLTEDGLDIEKFHACEDTDTTKTRVFDILERYSSRLRAYAIRVDKTMLPEEMKDAGVLYSKVFEWIIEEVAKAEIGGALDRVVIVTDSLPKEARRRKVERPLKAYAKRAFQSRGITYSLQHHLSCSDMNLQAVDYLSWAAYRKYTSEKDWPMNRVEAAFCEIGEVSYT